MRAEDETRRHICPGQTALVFSAKNATFKRKTSGEGSWIWKNNTPVETLNIVRGNQKQGWHVWGAGGAGKADCPSA